MNNDFDLVVSKLAGFSEDELFELNRLVVAEVKGRKRANGIRDSVKFKVGDRVRWVSRDGVSHEAVVLRVNVKTCSVRNVVGGQEWRVPFRFVEVLK